MTSPAPPTGQRLVLIDGHGIIHRAFHAIKEPMVVRRTGEVTTAVFGFANTLLKAIDDLRPTHLAVTMDMPGPTFRHERDATYKATRVSMPDELRAQMARVRDVIEAFSIPIFELSGFEADDLIGTLACQSVKQGIETYIVTLDSDLVQLVEPGVFVYMYRPYQRDTIIYDAEATIERYGVPPAAIPDIKGLKGDTSDNIPGVPGIGDKTAVRLVQEFGSVAALYERIDEVQPEKLRERLRENREIAFHSREMATIDCNAPVTLDVDACRVDEFERGRVLDLFNELEFRSLLGRVPYYDGMGSPEPTESTAPAPSGTECHCVTNREDLEALADALRDAGTFAFDTETDRQQAMRAMLVGIGVTFRPGQAHYVPVGHQGMLGGTQLPLSDVVATLGPVFADPQVSKIAHHSKFDMIVLERHGLPVEGLTFDTMIAAHLLGETALSLKTLSLERMNIELREVSEILGKGKKQITMAQVGVDEAIPYACADADMTLRLRESMEWELAHRGLRPLFDDIEIPLTPVLQRMEMTGVAVDTAVLREMSGQLATQLQELERRLFEEVGHEFAIGSPQQLSKVLFDELHLPKPRKTATGYTTDAQTLEKLRGLHPMIDLLLEHRQYAKIKSTYVDSLPMLIHPQTGRVHTTFSQTVAATGRLSSSDPNLQNIPVRTELGRQVRRAFIARDVGPNPVLLAADYSQIELRILAHLSRDPGLIKAFEEGEDIHRTTGSQMFGVAPEDVNADMRRIAKVMNFGVVYGLSEFGLTQRTDIPREVAGELIGNYFGKYPGIRKYIDETIAMTRQRGYAETLAGRRRYITELKSTNRQVQAAGERMAVNMPIQGSQADLIKIAMIRLDEALRREELRSRMILQVHDELIFECPEAELPRIRELALDIMPNAIPLDVPVEVEFKVGRTWGDVE